MNLDSFTGPGSTPSRRRFWDKVTAYVNASQKVAGKNVSVAEHQGAGTIINVPNPRRRPTGGVCCATSTITITFIGIVDCEPITGDLNGSFGLTETSPGSGLWECAGADYDAGFGPLHTVITVQCNDGGFSIDYRGGDTGAPAFFLTGIIAIPPSFEDIPNIIVSCDDGGAADGTATITCGGDGCSGACCDEEGNCTISTEAECVGTFQGVGTDCDPNPCGATGACCIDGECSILSEDDCATASGYYFGDGSDCDPDPCSDLGCCICPDFSCSTTLSGDCVDPCGFSSVSHCCPSGFEQPFGYCCDNGFTCCGGFVPNACCNVLTEQCVHPIDPESGLPGAFCCPIDWTPCGFEPCCDPETDVCCEVDPGNFICLPIDPGCP